MGFPASHIHPGAIVDAGEVGFDQTREPDPDRRHCYPSALDQLVGLGGRHFEAGIRKNVITATDRKSNRAVEILERWPRSWQLVAIGSLLLDLGAPVALLGHRIGRLWSLAAWTMHIGIKLSMNITFRYQLLGR